MFSTFHLGYTLLNACLAVGIPIICLLPHLEKAFIRDIHRQRMQAHFKIWWRKAKRLSRWKLALEVAAQVNNFLTYLLGENLFSAKMLWRCFLVSSCILTVTLATLGIIHQQPYGAAPWKIYKSSVQETLNVLDTVYSPTNITALAEIVINKSTNTAIPSRTILMNVNSNEYALTLVSNIIVDTRQISPIGNGQLNVGYMRVFRDTGRTNQDENIFGATTDYQNPFEEMSREMAAFRNAVGKYNTAGYTILYSIIYYIALLLANTVLFTISTAFCRVVLKEMVASGSIISAFCLVFTNVIVAIGLCLLILLIFTLIAIPILWLIIAVLAAISKTSLYAVIVFLLSASFLVWTMSGDPEKILVCITLLPTIIAALITGCTFIALLGRNAFYYFIRFFVIRCIEKSPIVVLGSTFTLIIGLITWLVEHIHPLGFL